MPHRALKPIYIEIKGGLGSVFACLFIALGQFTLVYIG